MQLKVNRESSLISYCKNSIGYLYKNYYKRNKQKNKNLVVFCYHDITDMPTKFQIENHLYTTTATFIKQIKWIEKNFKIINPRDGWGNEEGASIKTRPMAIITFDDGFYGAFFNGIKYLIEMKIPSIMFLNMKNIIDGTPLISSACLYLENEIKINKTTQKKRHSKQLHLQIDPNSYHKYNFILQNKCNDIVEYQGKLVNIDVLKKFDNPRLISYGNHLYEHYNSIALSNNELVSSYQKNEMELKKFKSYSSFFAYTNGRFGSCWNENTLKVIKQCGAEKIFSADGKINQNGNNFLLDRIALNENHNNDNKLFYTVFRGMS